MTFGSLFSGIGGFDKGFASTDFGAPKVNFGSQEEFSFTALEKNPTEQFLIFHMVLQFGTKD